jgi:4-amino-4-deoxy-L-arabinose transferase-like glycosyltransferase
MLGPATGAPASDRSTAPTAGHEARDRTRRWISIFVTLAVLAWSILQLINLGLNHTTGPELYGVAVAAVAVGTGVLSLALLASTRRRFLASVGVLVLWTVIALGGVAGAVAHIVGPAPGHGPIDTRPRPVAAPLIFTALGLAGGAAVVYGQRLLARRGSERGKE